MSKGFKIDVLDFARKLISFNTISGQGNENECARHIAKILEDAGYSVRAFEASKNRTSLTADLFGSAEKPFLCFTGHIDTVPLGKRAWSFDPFAGEISGTRLYGRGASDMKGGIAAIVGAAVEFAGLKGIKGGIHLAICAGEETGSSGAKQIVAGSGMSGKVGMIICAEPTSNDPLIGHKGVLWLEASTYGIAGHGSSPEQGENAIYKSVDAISRLRKIEFNVDEHPFLGKPTLNVGTIEGGEIINEIPDFARFRIDVRTIPGKTNDEYFDTIRENVGKDVSLDVLLNNEAVLSDPESEEIQMVYHIMEGISGMRPKQQGAAFFTDCSVLTPAYNNPPTVILGPGEAKMAHACDEYCIIERIFEATELFFEIGRHWLLDL